MKFPLIIPDLWPKEFGDDKSYRNFVDMLMRRAARLDIRQE